MLNQARIAIDILIVQDKVWNGIGLAVGCAKIMDLSMTWSIHCNAEVVQDKGWIDIGLAIGCVKSMALLL